ncbi:MAG: hypothetical protein ABL857_00205 [Rickettsiales bacterium]
MTQQIIIDKYSFNPLTKEITFLDNADVKIEGLQLITNLNRGAIIYQFNEQTKGGVLASNVLTLNYDTSTMQSSDILQIIYSPPAGGFFNRMLALLDQIWRATARPEWLVPLSTGKALRTVFDANSSLNAVTTVTTVTTCSTVSNLTNFNNIDSRELVWSQMRQAYAHGIRNRIN